MRKVKYQPLNRLELVLMAYFKTPWLFLTHDRPQQEAYYAEEHRYFSYEVELTKLEIQHIIRREVQQNFPALVTPHYSSVHNKLIATYFFKHIEVDHEEDVILALMLAEEEKAGYWDIWGVLDDGSILDPLQTEPYLSRFSGNKYNEIEIPVYRKDTK